MPLNFLRYVQGLESGYSMQWYWLESIYGHRVDVIYADLGLGVFLMENTPQVVAFFNFDMGSCLYV